MRTLKQKNVYLTGAASGIGRELAKQLAHAGANLFLVDVNRNGLEELAGELSQCRCEIKLHHCDLADPEAVRGSLDEFDRAFDVIDVVINNAGVAWYGATEDMPEERWDWLLRINLLAPIQITTHFLPQLVTRPESHVANMCSIAGLVAGGRFCAYNTSKFGLVGFSESVRAEYGRRGVGVSTICPGPVITNLYDAGVSTRPDGRIPTPPAWASATAEKVARLTIRAIYRNERQVLITPMAQIVSRLKRFVPGLLDFVTQFSRSRKKRRAQLELLEEERLQRKAADLSAAEQRRAA